MRGSSRSTAADILNITLECCNLSVIGEYTSKILKHGAHS